MYATKVGNYSSPENRGLGECLPYDGTGRKLRTVIGTAATDYIDGLEYEDNNLSVIHTEEGRIVASGYTYEYFLKDHLGNIRSGFKASGVTQEAFASDYYPFGLNISAGGVAPTPLNRYLLW